ncbi:MAG: methionyl-tRNA formyltransferase [bacterium]|nr:methionyl-tRNA formyltransferase [bacterium]
MLRTVFFGTPEFAVPTLAALAAAGYGPLRVITQPSRPVGRGRRLQDPPVAAWARERGIEVRQPERVKDPDFLAELEELAPDVAVVVAFGQIFRRRLLELPRHGCINVHASLLPGYRGAAPIQAAIAAGETRTGVTTMQMDRGLDSGPILLQEELDVGAEETAGELAPRLAELGAALLVRTLQRLEGGELEPRSQDETLVSHAPLLSKADGRVDWCASAEEIFNRLRAYTPWPGLAGELRGQPLKLLWARPLAATAETSGEVGTIQGLHEGRLAVLCGAGSGGSGTILGLERVQRPGKKAISASDFFNGQRLETGERFTIPVAH